MSAALVQAEGLGVHAGGRWLIRGIDLAVRAGEMVTVMGPNGGGKTTLLRTLLGLRRAHSGAVRRADGLRVSYVPSVHAAADHLPMTVARLMALTGVRRARRIPETLERTGARIAPDARVCDLSKGELQRVMLARALAREPGLLVLDEPLQGIDLNSEDRLYALIEEVAHRQGRGVLMASHDLHQALHRSDRLLCLNGTALCTGHPDRVLEKPAFWNMFRTHFRHCRDPRGCARIAPSERAAAPARAG